jgi:hypothetical protein
MFLWYREEALRQLCMPLQRIFCLHGVIEKRNGGAYRDWGSVVQEAEHEFEALTKSFPWKATHTSGGGGDSGGVSGAAASKAAKGTLGAFFKVGHLIRASAGLLVGIYS